MKVILVIAILCVSLMASSGLKKPVHTWREVRAQQQADSAVYEAVIILDSVYKAKRIK
jgi:hypothetical protein